MKRRNFIATAGSLMATVTGSAFASTKLKGDEKNDAGRHTQPRTRLG